MRLNTLSPAEGSTHAPKRVGRGIGSGLGKTCGRGHKGQKSRSGGSVKPGFEGGQMPLSRRIPKRGFTSQNRKEVEIVNLGDLISFGEGATIDIAALVASGLVRKRHDAVKVLGTGEALKGITLKVNRISSQAQTKIEAAGGTVELI